MVLYIFSIYFNYSYHLNDYGFESLASVFLFSQNRDRAFILSSKKYCKESWLTGLLTARSMQTLQCTTFPIFTILYYTLGKDLMALCE